MGRACLDGRLGSQAKTKRTPPSACAHSSTSKLAPNIMSPAASQPFPAQTPPKPTPSLRSPSDVRTSRSPEMSGASGHIVSMRILRAQVLAPVAFVGEDVHRVEVLDGLHPAPRSFGITPGVTSTTPAGISEPRAAQINQKEFCAGGQVRKEVGLKNTCLNRGAGVSEALSSALPAKLFHPLLPVNFPGLP